MKHLRLFRTLRVGTVSAAAVASLVCAQPAFAQAGKPDAPEQGVGAAIVLHAQMHVIGIDAASNSVTLRGPRGKVMTVAVSPDVADVRQLEVGDKLDVDYQTALLVRADKIASHGIRERVDTAAAIPASGGEVSAAHTIQVIATVQKIDRKHRRITLRGPVHTDTFQVSPDIPLEKLKIGDSVQAEFISATAVHLNRNGTSGH